MVIIFKDDRELIRYYVDDIPKSFDSYTQIKVDEIPNKEGYSTHAILVDGELVWEYRPIPKLSDEDLEEKVKELQETVDILLGGEEFD